MNKQGRMPKSLSNSSNERSLNPGLAPLSWPDQQTNMANQIVSNPAYDLARRCLGFNPITSGHVGKFGKYHEILDDEARFQAAGKDSVREFLHREMEMPIDTVEDIRIKNVFYPTIGALTGKLFAEFQCEEEVALIRQHARNLKETNGVRPMIIDYIPRSLVERHKAVEREAYLIRQSEMDLEKKTSKMATRIWITNDFELRARRKGDKTPWSMIPKVVMNNLLAQGPKSDRLRSDLLNKRTPPTPFLLPPKIAKAPTMSKQIEGFYAVLEDDCQI